MHGHLLMCRPIDVGLFVGLFLSDIKPSVRIARRTVKFISNFNEGNCVFS